MKIDTNVGLSNPQNMSFTNYKCKVFTCYDYIIKFVTAFSELIPHHLC